MSEFVSQIVYNLYLLPALTSGRRHSTLNKRTPLNKPIVSIVFLVLLSSIVVRQLCLLYQVRALLPLVYMIIILVLGRDY